MSRTQITYDSVTISGPTALAREEVKPAQVGHLWSKSSPETPSGLTVREHS